MNELKARVLAAAAAERSPARPAAARLRGLLLSGAILASLAIFALAGGVRPTGRPVALWLATSGGAIAIAAAAALLAFRRGRSMLGTSRIRSPAVATLHLSRVKKSKPYPHSISAPTGRVRGRSRRGRMSRQKAL